MSVVEKTITMSITIPAGCPFMAVHRMFDKSFKPLQVSVEESVPGATHIIMAWVGAEPQRPADPEGKGMPSFFFAKGSMGEEVCWPTVAPNIPVAFWLRNEADTPVVWTAELVGKELQ